MLLVSREKKKQQQHTQSGNQKQYTTQKIFRTKINCAHILKSVRVFIIYGF